MIKKIIGLVGLPGSGKTTWAIKQDFQGGIYYIDDLNDVRNLHQDGYHENIEIIYFSDPHLCHDKTRKIAEKKIKEMHPMAALEWIFWENDPDAAWENVKDRDNRIISKHWIKMLSDNYTPKGETNKIYRS